MPVYLRVLDISDSPPLVDWDTVSGLERAVRQNHEEESENAVQEESETETEFTEAARLSVASSPVRIEDEHEPFVSKTLV